MSKIFIQSLCTFTQDQVPKATQVTGNNTQLTALNPVLRIPLAIAEPASVVIVGKDLIITPPISAIPLIIDEVFLALLLSSFSNYSSIFFSSDSMLFLLLLESFSVVVDELITLYHLIFLTNIL